MSRIGDIVGDVKRQSTFWLNYPMNNELKLGDIVMMHHGVWIRDGNLLDDYGVKLTEQIGTTPLDPWVIKSESGVQFTPKIAGAASDAFKFLADAEAGVSVRFTDEDKFVLSMRDTTIESVSRTELWKLLRPHISRWTWNPSKRFVTELVRAGSATFLTSGKETRNVELKARGELPTGPVDAEISAGFELASTVASSTAMVGKENVLPLMRLSKVRVFVGEVAAAALDDVDSELVDDDEPDQAA
jgi:hypothetical protein